MTVLLAGHFPEMCRADVWAFVFGEGGEQFRYVGGLRTGRMRRLVYEKRKQKNQNEKHRMSGVGVREYLHGFGASRRVVAIRLKHELRVGKPLCTDVCF